MPRQSQGRQCAAGVHNGFVRTCFSRSDAELAYAWCTLDRGRVGSRRSICISSTVLIDCIASNVTQRCSRGGGECKHVRGTDVAGQVEAVASGDVV